MKTKRILAVLTATMALGAFALAEDAAPKMVSPTDAKGHVGEVATVCGKVVDTKTPKYGLAGHGKPVSFDIDQPEPNPVFYFVAFGTEEGGPQEVIDAYKGKNVCVTGKIIQTPGGAAPCILVTDRTAIKAK